MATARFGSYNLCIDKLSELIENFENATSSIFEINENEKKSSTPVKDSKNGVSTVKDEVNQLIEFLEDVNIFDCSTPLTIQQKFTNGLVQLGNILEQAAQRIFHMNKNKSVTVSIISLICCWENVIGFLLHYAPESLTEDAQISVRKNLNDIYQIISQSNFKASTKSTLNETLIRYQLEKERIDGNIVVSDDLFEKITNSWMILLDEYPYVIAQLNYSQLTILARFLLNNIQFSEDNILQTNRIQSKVVQDNEKLVTVLIYEIFLDIITKIDDFSSVTKVLLTKITKKSWDTQKKEKLLKICEKFLCEPQWIQNDNEASIIAIVQFLQVLLSLPLNYLNTEIKTIIFLVTFTIGKEWQNSSVILDLCTKISLEVLEGSNIPILQYIQPQYFIDDLPKNPALVKALQYSLSNVEHYDSIIKYLENNNNIDNESALILVECIEKGKAKLKLDKKTIARETNEKLCKRILDSFHNGITKPHQVRGLIVVLKAAIAMKKVDKTLVDAVQSALKTIFCEEDKNVKNLKRKSHSQSNDSLLTEGIQLVKVLLQSQSKIPIDKAIIRQTWNLMLKNPSADIVVNLLGITVPEGLQKILNTLQKQTIEAHKQNDESLFEKSLSIWCFISRVDMGGRSNNIRQKFLQTLMQYFCVSTIDDNYSICILKLFNTVISAKKTVVAEENIDLILLIAIRSMTNLKSVSVALCEQELELLLAFVKHRPGITADRLPILFSLYERTLRFIVDEARQENSPSKESQLRCLALSANKVAVALGKLKKDMTRVSPAMISNIVKIYAEGVVPTYVKEPLDDSVGIFLSICDHHSIPLLFRGLPSSMQGIFKSLYETYNKFYKFTGNI